MTVETTAIRDWRTETLGNESVLEQSKMDMFRDQPLGKLADNGEDGTLMAVAMEDRNLDGNMILT